MFGTTIEQEYAIAARLLGLDEAGVAELARAAVRAAFRAPAGLLAEIDAYASRAAPA
jgi:aminodeoxyfutalosine deaminase